MKFFNLHEKNLRRLNVKDLLEEMKTSTILF